MNTSASNEFEIAAQQAMRDLEKQFKSATPEQKQGIRMVVENLRKNYMNAGYKHWAHALAQRTDFLVEPPK